jgi:RNA polymerase sigma factor (sigma-70 family)
MSMDTLDKKFFTKLYELNADRVRKSLERLHIPMPDREDLLQQVFTIAVKKYRRRPPEPDQCAAASDADGAERAWLAMVTHHVVRNWYRRPYRRELLEPGALGSIPAEPADHRSPEQYASDQEIHACVHSIIDDSLDDELRDVFTLAYIEGISTEELAQLLNVPPSTVKSMLHRARNAFLREGRRRHAAGALLSALPLIAVTTERRWRAGVTEFLKYATGAAAGAGLAFALTPPAVPLLRAERTHLAEIGWEVAALTPPVVEPSQPAPIDVVPALPIPNSREDSADRGQTAVPRPAMDDVDETVRDELALIDRADWAIQRGNYDEALGYLERHKLKYPNGKLSGMRDNRINQVKQLTRRSTKISG